MRKRRIYLGLLLIAVAIGAIVVCSKPEREPEYGGRKLSGWVESAAARYTANWNQAQFDDDANAIRHIGTNALPYLLKWIRYHASDWKLRLSLKLQGIVPDSMLTDHNLLRAQGAQVAFEILGVQAVGAIGELSRLLNDRNAQGTIPNRAATALGYLGKDAVAPLLTVLTNQHARARSSAVMAIGRIGTNAGAALPALVRALKDSDQYIAIYAAYSLCRVEPHSQPVVICLTECLQDSRGVVRVNAVQALGSLRGEGRAARPALLSLLNDPDIQMRIAATNALLAIDVAPLEKRNPVGILSPHRTLNTDY